MWWRRSRPLASEVVSAYLRKRGLPPWTSFFVELSAVRNDQWGWSHYNWEVDGENYQILRTGCYPYVKYHCSRRPPSPLDLEDRFFRLLKVLNLGLPCLAYGIAAKLLISKITALSSKMSSAPSIPAVPKASDSLEGSLNPVAPAPPGVKVDYKDLPKHHFISIRYLFECAVKLKCDEALSSLAASLYHRFYQAAELTEYDPYLVSSTALFIAGKLSATPLRIRDVINVSVATLDSMAPLLELDEKYFKYRNSITSCELLMSRMLKGDLNVDQPHRYLLHYLKSMYHHAKGQDWESIPIARTSWTLLHDFHHSPAIASRDPQVVAIAIIFMTLQIYGIQLPDLDAWPTTLYAGATKDVVWTVVSEILDVYEQEENFKHLNR
ncbi:unnamed protein product [Cyprideis torosa]|uniref:Cyclin-Q n=1 Tax=Cyprideis torosa TaxID=163714 RepID=A0A7R8ZRR7_9CRUS|nr:unnamed protein product [Cyprideis torosa]CAG0899694.1 unnamed protein product [Cyprideis torosa]